MIVGAPVWTFWIAPILTVAVLGVVVGVAVLYVRKVVSPRYPRRP